MKTCDYRKLLHCQLFGGLLIAMTTSALNFGTATQMLRPSESAEEKENKRESKRNVSQWDIYTMHSIHVCRHADTFASFRPLVIAQPTPIHWHSNFLTKIMPISKTVSVKHEGWELLMLGQLYSHHNFTQKHKIRQWGSQTIHLCLFRIPISNYSLILFNHYCILFCGCWLPKHDNEQFTTMNSTQCPISESM